MREILGVTQESPRTQRRWFHDDYFDLFVSQADDGKLHGFQLCYGLDATERALVWDGERGYFHDGTDLLAADEIAVRESADGTPLAFTIKYNEGNRQRQDIAEIMQNQLAQIGIEAQPQVVEWATLLQQINDPKLRDFDGVIIGWVDFKLDDTDLFSSDRMDQPYAYTGTNNPKIDRLLSEISLTVDRQKAKRLWLDYQKELIKEQPYTYFYFPDRLVGVNNRVKGAVMDARGEWLNIKDWYLDPASR